MQDISIQGRYTQRHNKVLQELFERVKEKAKPAKTIQIKAKSIAFVKVGGKTVHEPCINSNYLNSAYDWQVKVDLRGSLKIPSNISITNFRPDMIQVSESTQQLGIIELTVPSEHSTGLKCQMR